MKHTISIVLTDEQINKILESRPQKIMEQETFSITGAAKIIGIGKTKIYAMLKSGKISKIMVGLSPRICREEIDRVKKLSATAV